MGSKIRCKSCSKAKYPISAVQIDQLAGFYVYRIIIKLVEYGCGI
jgi:hypothetical protein